MRLNPSFYADYITSIFQKNDKDQNGISVDELSAILKKLEFGE